MHCSILLLVTFLLVPPTAFASDTLMRSDVREERLTGQPNPKPPTQESSNSRFSGREDLSVVVSMNSDVGGKETGSEPEKPEKEERSGGRIGNNGVSPDRPDEIGIGETGEPLPGTIMMVDIHDIEALMEFQIFWLGLTNSEMSVFSENRRLLLQASVAVGVGAALFQLGKSVGRVLPYIGVASAGLSLAGGAQGSSSACLAPSIEGNLVMMDAPGLQACLLSSPKLQGDLQALAYVVSELQ